MELESQHHIEAHIERDLTEAEIGYLTEYLADDPMCTDLTYLVELFDLRPTRRSKRHALPQRQVDAIRDTKYTVISFHPNGKRALTYSGLNAYTALHEIMLKSQRQFQCIVIEGDIPVSQNSNSINDYWQYCNKDISLFPALK